MKKFGYTLAEVLITLTIVGVVAAITIPTFVSNSRNKANASKLSTVISAVENAYTTMMAAEGVNDLTETVYYSIPEDNVGRIAELSKYLKTSSNDSDAKVCIMKNGVRLEFNYEETGEITETEAKDNGFAPFESIAQLEIDVNGSTNKPNQFGRDKFLFQIGSNGTLYPAGGKAYTLLISGAKTWDESGDYQCTEGKITEGCTARLIEEGFQVNY